MDSHTSSSDKVIDFQQLLDRGFDEKLILDIVPICIEDNKERLGQLWEAIEKEDIAQVKYCSHSLKGASANIGALNFANAAQVLEEAADEEDLSNAKELYIQIEMEFVKLEKFVSQPNWLDKLVSSI